MTPPPCHGDTVTSHGTSSGSSPGRNHGHGALRPEKKTWGRHVEPQELGDPAKLFRLACEAAKRGHVSGSDHDFGNVLGAAVHAVRTAKKNVVGMFVDTVLSRRWENVTPEDEIQGRKLVDDWNNRQPEDPRSA